MTLDNVSKNPCFSPLKEPSLLFKNFFFWPFGDFSIMKKAHKYIFCITHGKLHSWELFSLGYVNENCVWLRQP